MRVPKLNLADQSPFCPESPANDLIWADCCRSWNQIRPGKITK
jgi:hypothetical protein